MKKIPVLIDTDPGIDDAFAIMLAASSEELDIKALTVTAGNVGLNKTLINALGLCEILNIDVPVHRGAEKPIIAELKDASEYHGNSGLGGYVFRNIKKKVENEYAWDAIYKVAKENHGELTIITLGPLTNLAITLLKYPDLPKYVKRVVIMGGAFGVYGNCVPYSEFNFWIDPHAVNIVINSELNTEIYGLDTTRQTTMTADEFNLLKSEDKKIDELINHMRDFNRTSHLPDTVAVAAAIKPEIFTIKKETVVCSTNTGITQGWSIIDKRNKSGKEPNTYVALSVDKKEFLDLLLRINTLRGDV